MNRLKKGVSVILRMMLCILIHFVLMYIFMLFVNGTEVLTKKGMFYPASIIFEMFALIAYIFVFKKNIKKKFNEDSVFEIKDELKEYYLNTGKSHLIFYSIFFVFGFACTLFSADAGGILTIIIPLTGIFSDSLVILGIIIGYVFHIFAITYLVVLLRFINYRKRKSQYE